MNSASRVPHIAFVALGSNVGDSATILRQAIVKLQALSAQPLRTSSFWQTSPVDCPPGSPPFVNAVVGMTPPPSETPESFLSKLLTLEKEFGRRPKKVVNEPRRLDLDLIAFNNEARATTELNLPHPRACQRRFVLQPLAEIAPGFILPGQTKTISQLLAVLNSTELLVKLNI